MVLTKDVNKKTPDTSGLVNITVFNTKISQARNKIPDTRNLMSTTVLNTILAVV